MKGFIFRAVNAQRSRSKMAGLLASVALFAYPLGAAWSQEPPEPSFAPRLSVEKGKKVHKGDVPAANDLSSEKMEAEKNAQDAASLKEKAQEEARKKREQGEQAPDAAQAPQPVDSKEPSESAKADAPAPEPTPEERQRILVERSHKRANLLKALQGGPEVVLEKDTNNPPNITEPLRMEEAVAFALKNNFEVLQASSLSDATYWDSIAGYSAFIPTVSYELHNGVETSSPASYQVETKINGSNQPVTVYRDTHHTWSTSFIVHQPIIDLTIISSILQRNNNYDATKSDEVAAREKAAYDTITSFLRVAKSRLVINFTERYKSNLDKLAQRMKDRVAGGGAPGVEMDRLTARSVAAKSAIIEARSEYQASMVEFRRLTGVSPLKFALPDALLPVVPGKVEDVLVRAVKNNPEIQAANSRTDMAMDDVYKSWSNLLPKLGAQFSDSRAYNVGGVAHTDMATCPAQGTSYYDCVYPAQHTITILGIMTWQLQGGMDIAGSVAGLARARAANYAATDLRMKMEESVRVGYDAMNAANGRIEAVGKSVEANTKVARAFEEQYLAGSRQLLDLLDAYERLYQSQRDLVTLLTSEAQAGYLMRRQMGELVGAIMSPDNPE